MMLKNEIFAYVLDWLVREKMVEDQKDLAKKTGISQNTISRIMTGKVEPKDDTLRKLNDAFGHIFNMQYLRGRSTKMLMGDAIYYEQRPHEDLLYDIDRALQQQPEYIPIASESNEPPYSHTPHWAQQMTKKMEELIHQNQSLHQELNKIKIILQNLKK